MDVGGLEEMTTALSDNRDGPLLGAADKKIPRAPISPALVSVRMWNEEARPSVWSHFIPNKPSPLSCLITEVAAASGSIGLNESAGVLVARFETEEAATVAAIRIQWAVRGFSERSEWPESFATILLDFSRETDAGSFLLRGFPRKEAGKIFLTKPTYELLKGVPGLTFDLEPYPQDLCELICIFTPSLAWTVPETSGQSGRAKVLWGSKAEAARSENSYFAKLKLLMVAALGRVKAVKTSGAAHAQAVAKAIGGLRELRMPKFPNAIGLRIRAVGVVVTSVRITKRQRAIGLIVACAVLLLGGVGNFAFRSRSKATQVRDLGRVVPGNLGGHDLPPTTNGQGPAPKSPDNPTEKGNTTVHPRLQNPEQRTLSRGDPSATPVVTKRPKTAGKACEIDARDVGAYISRAQSKFSRGLYQDARRQFGEVLACDPRNAKAQAGFERATKAEETSH